MATRTRHAEGVIGSRLKSYVGMDIILLMFLARFATHFCKEAFSCFARFIIFDRPKMVQGFIAAK